MQRVCVFDAGGNGGGGKGGGCDGGCGGNCGGDAGGGCEIGGDGDGGGGDGGNGDDNRGGGGGGDGGGGDGGSNGGEAGAGDNDSSQVVPCKHCVGAKLAPLWLPSTTMLALLLPTVHDVHSIAVYVDPASAEYVMEPAQASLVGFDTLTPTSM